MNINRLLQSLFIIPILLFSECVCDYDIDQRLKKSLVSKVVVNSIICPDSLIRIKCYWSRRYDDTADYRIVESFSGKILEEGVEIASFSDVSGEVLTDRHPVTGKKYELKITIPGYGDVSAATNIPLAPRANIAFKESKAAGRYGLYHHFNVSSIGLTVPARAVWINASLLYGDDYLCDASTYYCNNPFLDQINAANDPMDNTASGSNISFGGGFMRIPYKNIALAGDIAFSFSGGERQYPPVPYPLPEEWNWEQYEELPLTWLYVNVTAPSDDYDKYFRSLYKQWLYNHDPDLPFLEEIVPVYSNIQNGLGIFAGYNSVSLHHKYNIEEGQK